MKTSFATRLSKRKYSDIKRIQQVANVFAKHGFGYFVQHLRNQDHFIAKQLRKWKLISKKDEGFESLTIAQRLRKVLEELGPTYIKLGQILSTRPDLIPIELCEEFAGLQDSVAPVPFEDIEKQILEQFGKPSHEVFLSFDKTPHAAASIAQVHTAVVKDGQKVIVKILRPGAREKIGQDIQILRTIADLIHRHIPPLSVYDLPSVVNEFARTITNEMDFTREAYSIDRFRRNFARCSYVKVPITYWDYIKPQILTLERLEGEKLKDLICSAGNEQRKRIIARRGANAMLKQIFIDGFFHADPHPGNLFTFEDDTIAFIDFGMMSSLTKSLRSALCDILISIVNQDTDRTAALVMELGKVDPARTDINNFKRDFHDFIDQYYNVSIKHIRMDKVFSIAMALVRTYEIKVPRDLYLMVKTLILSEGVAKQIDPDFNMVEQAKPFVRRMIAMRYHPRNLLEESQQVMRDTGMLLRSGPSELLQILRNMRQGHFKVDFQHRGLDELITELDRSSNRISFSLVIAALIVGSSLVMLTNMGPMFMGYPALGVIGYSIAAVMGFWLAISIIRSNKL
ncbi:MAG: AarF/ABC1/UbiB kinase family protein [Candidatus Auribacterota bacterium]|jgi:ubiquinone biosynthesis protein|nr:AarF/ABC1/UbiB kinase family protein [Candidatus Auribacterota bacterium]